MFLARGSLWDERGPLWVRAVNRAIPHRLRLKIARPIDPARDMSTVEMRMNTLHLADQVLAYGVAGDFVELGTFVGESALLLAKALQAHGDPKTLHCYDSFEHQIGETRPPRQVLEERFERAGLSLPRLHVGRFEQTVPSELPEAISLVHIDCGWGGDIEVHARIVQHCLEHTWPRLSPGGILLLTDYCDPDRHPPDQTNPGVKVACDRYFGDALKPWQLWGGGYTQGFLRKPLPGDRG